jgi:hypothetical protein
VRSAALLISIFVDADGGAPWYAQLSAFADPAAGELHTRQVSDPDELALAVRRWLDTVLGAS